MCDLHFYQSWSYPASYCVAANTCCLIMSSGRSKLSGRPVVKMDKISLPTYRLKEIVWISIRLKWPYRHAATRAQLGTTGLNIFSSHWNWRFMIHWPACFTLHDVFTCCGQRLRLFLQWVIVFLLRLWQPRLRVAVGTVLHRRGDGEGAVWYGDFDFKLKLSYPLM